MGETKTSGAKTSGAVSPYMVRDIIQELTDKGVIPKECRRCTIEFSPNEPVIIRSEVYVTRKEFIDLANALTTYPEDCRKEFIAIPVPGEAGEVLDVSVLQDEFRKFVPQDKQIGQRASEGK